jgi:two-component system cell cycle response regulator CtrA
MDTLIEQQQTRIWELEERVRQLEEALSPRAVSIPVEWGLTTSEARMFAHLTTKPHCSKDSLMAALYGLKPDDDEPEVKIVDVFVCKMRRKLKPFGVEIITIWGQGYSLKNREFFSGRVASC